MPPPPLPQPSSLRPGVRLEGDRYSLLRPLGAGGNGIVWLARQESLATDVVVKFPKRWDAAGTAETELFINEMRRLASLSSLHPHIVNILDAGSHHGRPFFVMQYLAKGALDRYCAATPPGEASLDLRMTDLAWVEAIAGALDFVHERSTIHRDVKPANILLDESRGAYLADFGIAIPLSPESQTLDALRRQRESVTGSLPYLAPELLAGGAASAASDQFALAVTIFEFIAKSRPFAGETADEVLKHYRHRMAVGLKNACFSAPIVRILGRAFSASPMNRYPSCTAMAHAVVLSLRSHVPPIPRPPSSGT